MQNFTEILSFYKSLINKGNLFDGAPFTDEGFHLIDKDIENKNQDFFDLLLQLSYSNDFNYKSLQIVFNQLSELYWDLHGDFFNHQINIHENTPLFRFPIKFDGSQVTKILSCHLILSGISKIYWHLETNFSKEIELGERLMPLSYVPAYFDCEGYMRHIYEKLVSEDCLEKEFYNHKNYQVQKIGEFLQLIPSNIMVGLPIDFQLSLRNDDSNGQFESNYFIDFYWRSNIDLDILSEIDEFKFEGKENSTAQTVSPSGPLFKFVGRFNEKDKEKGYEKDLFNLLRDYFKLFPKETSIATFRKLLSQYELETKIVVEDSKKLVAIVKFLKTKKVISLHHHYFVKIANSFNEPNGKEIAVKSLHGSKMTLTYEEEKILSNLFRL